ncbi:hypothetical protein OG579_16845 [Williamsia herbipolensis]|uniref:Uncharacterized protein n=1 Tax=Williamsia herbipolensis TaxID=1603258 RepID=A0AAU4JZY9_9NOCA|nr:hypothetical protein [Williamsia herbipolensis]
MARINDNLTVQMVGVAAVVRHDSSGIEALVPLDDVGVREVLAPDFVWPFPATDTEVAQIAFWLGYFYAHHWNR